MAIVVSFRKLQKLKYTLAARQSRYKKYIRGLSGVGKARTIDLGYTPSEARRFASQNKQLRSALPRFKGGITRKNPSKVLLRGQAAAAYKKALNAPNPFEAKLNRKPTETVIGRVRVAKKTPLTVVQRQLKTLREQQRNLKAAVGGSRQRKFALQQVSAKIRHLGGSKPKQVSKGGFIYKVTDKRSGKVYIGQTIYPVAKRIHQHITQPSSKFDAVFSKNPKQFKVRTIAKASTKADLDRLERRNIAKFDAANPRRGFNTVAGNAPAVRKQIKSALQTIRKAKNKSLVKKAKKYLKRLRTS